jgi:hypothetical protein
LDAKWLKSLGLVSLHPISTSGAIQSFEQPHRFAASNGSRSGEAFAARDSFSISDP